MDGFVGTERFKILRRVGSGGMGIVYEALDTQADTRVALKTLQRLNPQALYLFKNEFRSLANIVHPNLVSFFELFSEQDQWFFTMEFIQGTSFLAYVRPHSRVECSAPEVASSIEEPETAALFSVAEVGHAATPVYTARPVLSCDVPRLRNVFGELVDGLCAVHAAGKLHRDIKPSNVMVALDGRTVVLDFGLVLDLNQEPVQEGNRKISGTVAYMSPEQAAGTRLTQASDWYSVGVMLYQVLTGTLPFSGAPQQVLIEKQTMDPPRPCDVVQGVPEDLNCLCMELLNRNSESRPRGRELLGRLRGAPTIQAIPVPVHSREAEPVFVGRTRELELLQEAFATVQNGHAALVYIHGESGVGKSALIQRFLEQISSHEPMVLSGRCYEQESVPYKALDSAIDALSHHLRHMTRPEIDEVLPRDFQALARIFPTLRGFESEADAARVENVDSQELRRRAFEAFRELLARMARRKLVVLQLDDLHWGDADSAMLLLDVLRPPDPPPLLVLCAYRSGYEERSACLRSLLRPTPQKCLLRFDVALECLSATESQSLSEQLIPHGVFDANLRAETIAQESRGHPYFIRELAYSSSIPNQLEILGSSSGEATLDSLIWSRVSHLPGDVRRLLEIIALSGQPLTQIDAHRAAGFPIQTPTPLAVLRSAHLVRTMRSRELDEVEPYHDRIRETIVGHLSANDLKTHHFQLAITLEGSGRGDAETLAIHFEKAGHEEKAGAYYIAAGDQAAAAVAFDHSVHLYRRALANTTSAGQMLELQVKLADALANAGRGLEAAQSYQQAALVASQVEILVLERKAAYQYCISGHIDEGVAAFRKVLARVNLHLPKTRLGCLASLAVMRVRLLLRGMHFREKAASDLPPAVLNRIDVAWSAGVGLLMVDPFAGMGFLARSLLLALQAAEPYRIARSLGIEAPTTAVVGQFGRRRSRQLLDVCSSIGDKLNNPEVRGWLRLGQGGVSFGHGRWAEARRELAEAEQTLGEQCTGVSWELGTVRAFSQITLHYLGQYAEMSARSAVLLKDARKRGDLYAATNICVWSEPLTLLAADRPEAARSLVLDALAEWSQSGYHQQRSMGNLVLEWIHLYMGEGPAAWLLVQEQWPLLKNSLLLRADGVWIPFTWVRAASAVAAAVGADDSESLLRSAERDARKLERQALPYGKAWAKLIRAGVAGARGDNAGAIAYLEDAVTHSEALDMGLVAATARRRLGQLIGAERGQALIREADEWMTSQNIRNPVRMTAMYVTGFADPTNI